MNILVCIKRVPDMESKFTVGVSTVVDFAITEGTALVKRELEGGVRACVRVQTPAVFTCQLGLNTPRYPTLPNIMKAKKKELLSIPVADLLRVDPRQKTEKIYFPEKKGGGLVLEGEAGDLADQLIKILKEKTAVLS
jgi:electron transfer flavoprotein beta subunit